MRAPMKKNQLVCFVCITAVLEALLSESARCTIIPSDRLYPWPGNVGVPGGIPNRSTIGKNAVTDYGADPTGVNDSTVAIQNTIANTPAGQVAFVPAGTYRVSGNIYPFPNVTLRGAGMGITTFMVYSLSGNGMISNSGNDLSS